VYKNLDSGELEVSNKENSVDDFLVISWTCLTTKWCWLPACISLYVSIGMWIMVNVHPLAVLALPAIVTLYAFWNEDKRLKAMYGLDRVGKQNASPPIFAGLQRRTDQLVDEYIRILEEKK